MKKDSRKYNIYHGVMAGGRWVLFAIVSFIILFPVYWIFISSITPSGELFKTPIDYLPDHPTLESYKFLIENVGLLSKVGNTVLIVGLTLVISTVLCAMAAYGFSRFTTKGINIAFAFIIATMLIPEVVTARPLYEFMQKVKLYDTYPGLILLYIATVCIINFITCLNNFFTPLFYSNGIQVLSVSIVQLPLRDNMYGVPWDLVSAMGWIILLPIIIFVAVFEKQIMDGIMAGGVKA